MVLVLIGSFLFPSISKGGPDYRNQKVEALLQPLGHANNPSVYTPHKDSKAYKELVSKLANPSAKTLQLLMDEVTNIGALKKEETKSSNQNLEYRVYRIYEAFQMVGTNAAPLLPKLKDQFLSGSSVYASEYGLLAIRGNAWRVLLEGLTNSDPQVQLAASASMRYVKGADASFAFPYLARFATNQASSFKLRAISVGSIMDMAVNPELKVPILIQVAKWDTNIAIRCAAIGGLGYTGVSNESALSFLEQISKDQNEHVRLAAAAALEDLKKEKNE